MLGSMNAQDRLNGLGKRLNGLSMLHDRFTALPSSSVNGAQEKALLKSAVGLAGDYLDMHATLAASPDIDLPAFDQTRLAQLVAGALDDSVSSQRAAHLAEIVLHLSMLRNDIDAVMADGQEEIRSRAERAFLHLQWSIAANRAVRLAWIRAYRTDEPACAALGAAHLLLHGIFAFKATSSAARTDLVFHEPLENQSPQAVADGLVLTEWKRLTDAKKLDEIIRGAEVQADLYTTGVLGGRELRRVRYVVVVSSEQVAMPSDLRKDGYLIRHVNIAVRPNSPSIAAPALAKATK
jgi:hypothetical protein